MKERKGEEEERRIIQLVCVFVSFRATVRSGEFADSVSLDIFKFRQNTALVPGELNSYQEKRVM